MPRRHGSVCKRSSLGAQARCSAAWGAPSVELVSRGTIASTLPSNGFSVAASISTDGRYVVFESAASNLGPVDANGLPDIYLADRVAGNFTLMSRRGGVPSNGRSWSADLSSDAGRVAFVSDATSLASGDENSFADVFVLERLSGAIRRLDPNPGIQANGTAIAVQIS
jgi:Tol biopolymer transport system component